MAGLRWVQKTLDGILHRREPRGTGARTLANIVLALESNPSDLALPFVLLGALWLVNGIIVLGTSGRYERTIVASILTLFYLIPGTLVGLTTLVLSFHERRRATRTSRPFTGLFPICAEPSVLSRNWVRLTAKEHVAAFILASFADIQLLIVVSQLAARAGQQVNLVGAVGVHELLLTILIFGVTSAGTARRGWRWQYVASSVLFSGYVGYRMGTRFISALEFVHPLQSEGIGVSEYLGFFYALALASAISYVLMILVLRRAYGKLVSARSVAEGVAIPQSIR